jgi:hypothetical protein
VLALVARRALGAVLALVAPHVPLVHALVVRCVRVAVRSRVVKRLVVQLLVVLRRVVPVRLRASECFLQLRLRAPQRSAPVRPPYQERP